jgi:anti-sigma B factor antagonist
MELNVEVVKDVAVVKLFLDELDASNSGEFKHQIAPVLSEHAKLVIDLGELRFIDSSGLGAMLSCLRQATARGGDLKLCQLSPAVRAAFELVRLHRVIDIHASATEAVQAFLS